MTTTQVQSTLPAVPLAVEKPQQFRNSIEVFCFNKKIMPALLDHFSLSRKGVLVLNSKLEPVLVDIPGPRARIRLVSSRLFRVDMATGQVMIMTHANDKKPEFLHIYPVWSEDGKEVKAVKDSRGGYVRVDE